ncbi:uncharacterized protein LOC134233200 [Saccostrea cucullata]|uniref:uncharacterized protein LOC134233200 n=1 Tax=Saccostrea cuccullata TaxID=36930 RepID=UPI002ED67095
MDVYFDKLQKSTESKPPSQPPPSEPVTSYIRRASNLVAQQSAKSESQFGQGSSGTRKASNLVAQQSEHLSELRKIANNFQEIMEVREFFNLDLDTLCVILSADNIKVKSEFQIFLVAASWINHHDYEERVRHIEKDMGAQTAVGLNQDDPLEVHVNRRDGQQIVSEYLEAKSSHNFENEVEVEVRGMSQEMVEDFNCHAYTRPIQNVLPEERPKIVQYRTSKCVAKEQRNETRSGIKRKLQECDLKILFYKAAFYLKAAKYMYRMNLLFWTLIAVVVTSVIFAQTGNDIVDNGISAGTELAKAIGDKDFASTMGKLATKVGPYLGMVGPAIGIIAAIAGFQQESAELKFMREMLSRIENRVDKVDQKLDEIARRMDWNRAQVQFFTFEKKIKAMKLELEKFYNVSSKDFTTFRDTFTTIYECVYENSAQMLYSHIVSSGSTFSSNVLTEAVRANQNDRRDMQAFMLGLTKLILMGSQMEMAYYKIKFPNSLKGHEQKWTNQIKEMGKAMKKVDSDLKKNYKDVATNDAKTILTNNRGASKSDVAKKVYDKLTTKFYWRNWFVAVYNDISGDKNHWV